MSYPDRWRDEWNDLPEDMRDFATHVGPTDAHILLLGEPGSGKGYLARILHDLSPRAHGPFVPQDGGVFTETLAEAKLFGNVRGAYTGATDSRPGVVEAASGGTLFLDELGALPGSEEVAEPPKPKSDEDMKRELVEALEAAGGIKSEAARLIGIHRTTVHRRLKRYGMGRPE